MGILAVMPGWSLGKGTDSGNSGQGLTERLHERPLVLRGPTVKSLETRGAWGRVLTFTMLRPRHVRRPFLPQISNLKMGKNNAYLKEL